MLVADEKIMVNFIILLLFIEACAITTASYDEINKTENYTSSNRQFNLTRIVMETILYCGPKFVCNKSYIAHLNITQDVNMNFSACGTCHCDEFEACDLSRQETPCCPDIFFEHGYMQCKDLTLVKGIGQPNFYSVIDSCLADANVSLSRNCSLERSTEELIRTPPVTSEIFRRTYKNMYCALCNNVTDFREWNFEINCLKAMDFNYLSSYTEIIQLAEDRNCSIPYTTTSLSTQRCPVLHENVIDTCNVSGTWHFYDEMIELACLSSYHMSFRGYTENSYRYGFKNIFCAMCNPPKFDPGMYRDTCMDTRSVNYAICKILPSVEASFPFKNHFCLMCNHGDHINVLQELFIENIEESYESTRVHPFTTRLSFNFKTNRLKEYVNQKRRESNNFTQYSSPIVNLPVNVSSLVHTNFALSGEGSCDMDLLPNYTMPLQRACSCDIGCRTDCCVDFALTQPWICVKEDYQNMESPIVHDSYLTIGGCLKNDGNIKHLCTDRNNSDFYQILPLTKHNGNRETYANIFCYLCNQKKVDNNVIERMSSETRLWGLITECEGYINHRYFSLLQDYLDFAKLNYCFIKLKPLETAVSCKINDPRSNNTISNCKDLKQMASTDSDVKYACENLDSYRFPNLKKNGTVYKNKFCVVCNSVTKPVINDCQVSSSLTSLLNKTCHDFPRTSVCSNYRNIFCEICHAGSSFECFSIFENRDRTTIVPTISPPSFTGAFRSMFSILPYDKEHVVKKATSCQSDQMFDLYYNTCQNISCFPGKVLVNGSCKSLLEQTSNLRYTIALKAQFKNLSNSQFSLNNYMKKLRESLIKGLSERVGNNLYFVEDVTLVSFANCNSKVTESSEFYIHLNIFFDVSVNRNNIEERLIEFTTSSIARKSHYLNIGNVQLMQSQIALFLPSLWWKTNTENNCWLLTDMSYHGDPVFRNVFVDSLLTCPQILIRNHAFGVPWENIKNTISLQELSLNFHQFHDFDGNGKRVCVRDIQHYIEHYQSFQKEDIGQMPLTILTIVCMVISLICLALTFVTYMTFPNLRTIPGLNNVFLIVSLFTAQTVLLVRQFSIHEDYSSLTIIVSAVTHFSWLSAFLWLQVCSYHMYVVFTSKLGKEFRKEDQNKTVVKYTLYTYGASLVIVLLNIIISLISSSGRDTGYDKTSTLFTYKTAFVVTFIAPVIYVCTTNMIFYIATIYKIISCPHVENSSGNRVHFAVYIKLFSLTGLTWVLQIIDVFLAISVLSYFVAVLNGLQGSFIFVSYVCNNRVIKMWKNVCSSSLFRHTHSQLTSIKSETTSL